MAKDKVMDFNLEDFNFEELSSDVFGNSVTTAKLNPDLQGKIFAIYGENNTGKTTQAAKMVQNSFLIPVEQGSNALGKGTQILKTSGWADIRKHTRTLTTNKKLLGALQAGITIGVIIDGIDNLPLFIKQFVSDQAGVEKFQKAGSHGGQWEDYSNEMFWFVTKLTQVGYTLFFIGHPHESKNEPGLLDLIDDKRVAKPIKNVCDFVIYLEDNGSDEENNVIRSSAYLTTHKPTEETYGFFARSRFPYVQTFFPEWNAEVVRQAIYDGIVEQAEVEGAELVGFSEVSEKYETTFDLSYDEAMNQIFEMLDKCDEKGLTEKADDVLLQYLDNAEDVSNLKEKQMQTIQSIHDELEHLLSLN